MDLNAVRMFIAVAQSGSLSAAAEKLGIPLPTVSRRISELEQSLKIQLMERSKRGIKLTTGGQRLFDQALYGIESLLEAERTVQSDMQQMHGRLRLSLPEGFEVWGELLIDFQRRYPHIQIMCHFTDARLDLTADGIDVALRIGDLVTDKVIAKRLAPIQSLLVATPQFIAEHGYPSKISDLDNFPLAGYYFNHSETKWHIDGNAYLPNLAFSANNFRVLLHYTLNNMAICELPEFIARPHLASGELVQILPQCEIANLPVYQIYTALRHPSAIVRAYLEFCDEWLQGKTA